MAEPLIAGGVRCHGGFDDDGTYVSPAHQVPRARPSRPGRRSTREQFGTEMLDIPLETWPEHFPNVAQARFLIKAGVPEPLIATLTRIGTVEGFGANIRLLQPGDMQRHFDEDITRHRHRPPRPGLFEAHGRDEAGWEEEAGHKDMWFAARDIAFENPHRRDRHRRHARPHGLRPARCAGGVDVERAAARRHRLQPRADRQPDDPRAVHRDLGVPHLPWAEEWLSDTDLVAGDGEAADLVSYIRADETPHVELPQDRAHRDARPHLGRRRRGKKHTGTEMIGTLWDRGLEQSLGAGREQTRKAVLGEVEHWCLQHAERRRTSSPSSTRSADARSAAGAA